MWTIFQVQNIQFDNGEELKSLKLNQQYKTLRCWRNSDHQQNNQINTHK